MTLGSDGVELLPGGDREEVGALGTWTNYGDDRTFFWDLRTYLGDSTTPTPPTRYFGGEGASTWCQDSLGTVPYVL